MKNAHGGMLHEANLQSEAYNFTKSNTPLWVFFMFFKLYKRYQIAQCITNIWQGQNTPLKRRKNAKLWLKSNMYANSLCIKRYGDNCVFSGFPKKQFRVVSVQAIYLFRFWWAGYTWGILYSESCLTLNLFKRIIKICQGETN